MVSKISLSPHRYLDELQLYTQVLDHAFPNIAHPLADRLKLILGSIVFLRDPLSALSLELLLKLTANTVHSVIIVPENDVQVIRLLHPSFFDFMTDLTRCRNPEFVANPVVQHTLLARACLDSMMCLRRDIVCEIKNLFVLNSEVVDLPSRNP
jgi:hypothetical protein